MTQMVQLSDPQSKGYKLFANQVYDDPDSGVIRYLKGYAFNVTNPVAVLEHGAKPILEQFGKLRYDLLHRTAPAGVCKVLL